jgi:hypothetical protein
MDMLSDRIGILLKYGKFIGSLMRRYFYIDNNGLLHYSESENSVLSITSQSSYSDEEFVKMFSKHKYINLNNSTFRSGIKPYFDKHYNLQTRSYIEINTEDGHFLMLFPYLESNIQFLYDYISSFQNKTIINENEIVLAKTSIESETRNIENRTNSIFKGKYVNQNNWQLKYIRVVNPTSAEEEYEETWIELENGSNYSGPVKRGMPHGFGKEYRPDGTLYTGHFYEGKWHGYGTLTFDTLDTFSGEFINGCICGI